MFLAGRHDAGIGQSAVDENLQYWPDLKVSNSPYDPSLFDPLTMETSLQAASTVSGSGTSLGPTATVANPPHSHQCQSPGCMKTFSRLADLRRHSRLHDPATYRFCCELRFTRMDKLNDHLARKHR
jgi:uncharacterized Zn-finger protein